MGVTFVTGATLAERAKENADVFSWSLRNSYPTSLFRIFSSEECWKNSVFNFLIGKFYDSLQSQGVNSLPKLKGAIIPSDTIHPILVSCCGFAVPNFNRSEVFSSKNGCAVAGPDAATGVIYSSQAMACARNVPGIKVASFAAVSCQIGDPVLWVAPTHDKLTAFMVDDVQNVKQLAPPIKSDFEVQRAPKIPSQPEEGGLASFLCQVIFILNRPLALIRLALTAIKFISNHLYAL